MITVRESLSLVASDEAGWSAFQISTCKKSKIESGGMRNRSAFSDLKKLTCIQFVNITFPLHVMIMLLYLRENDLPGL